MASVDPSRPQYVESLNETALAILTTGPILLAISALAVSFRLRNRFSDKKLGWDDGLMLLGLCIYTVDVGFACEGARSGLGTKDVHLNANTRTLSKFYLFVWLMIYEHAHAVIKSAICVTMLRVAHTRQMYRTCVYGMLGLNVCYYLVTFIGTISLCRPIAATWDPELAVAPTTRCAPTNTLLGISYAGTGLTMFTDLGCAVLPGFVLWRVQMKPQTKALVFLLLSFGSLACIATIVRTPYIIHYKTPEQDFAFWSGHIVLWSNIETAVGLIAGSAPSLRIHRWAVFRSSQNDISMEPVNIVTIGGGLDGRQHRRRVETLKTAQDRDSTALTAVHSAGEGDWSRLYDENSVRDGPGTPV